MHTCIYCRTTRPNREFDREHVLPAAFGAFKDSLVLHHAVCKLCNSYFGRTIDRRLARESIEGLERYQFGVKPPEEIANFVYRTLTLAVDQLGPTRVF
jgi:hypothetical protein